MVVNKASASHLFCFSRHSLLHYYFALLFPCLYSIHSNNLLGKGGDKNKFNVLQYITHGPLCQRTFILVCSSEPNYCMWQLFRGVLMFSSWMGTTNIMTWWKSSLNKLTGNCRLLKNGRHIMLQYCWHKLLFIQLY